ncbi:MAG: hypothetical protein ABFR90_04215 [Planctomycetota bacterium]
MKRSEIRGIRIPPTLVDSEQGRIFNPAGVAIVDRTCTTGSGHRKHPIENRQSAVENRQSGAII